jgi:hypothetical protein
MSTRLARLTPATIAKTVSKETSFRQAGGALLALALLLLPFFMIGVFAYTDPVYADGLVKFGLISCVFAFSCAVGVSIWTVILKGVDVVRGRPRPLRASPMTAEQHAAEQRLRVAEQARNLGLDAVQKELRAISLPRRRVYSEAEAEAWSELAAAFDDEYKQQGWR